MSSISTKSEINMDVAVKGSDAKNPTSPASISQDRERLLRAWTPGFRVFKRSFDVIVGAALLICALPLTIPLAILIRLDSPGPVIYSQNRLGRDGVVFRMYKFRTMRTDAEEGGGLYTEKNDPRITRIGRFLRKTRIDELPQLWNVLRSEMSIIGPRPERPENEQMLEKGILGFSRRTYVRPGLTGWAQICAPYANTIEQSGKKLEFDLYYISHASVTLDLKIAWRTALIMLKLAGQ